MSNIIVLPQIVPPTELEIRDWHGQRVVTLPDIDRLHRRPEGTAGRNFRENRDRFIVGEDYFELNQPDDIRRAGLERPQGGTPEKMVLMTETGYLMLVKSFTDDLAWQVQRILVNAYFRVKDEARRSSKAVDPVRLLRETRLTMAKSPELWPVLRQIYQQTMGIDLPEKLSPLASKTAPQNTYSHDATDIISQLFGNSHPTKERN